MNEFELIQHGQCKEESLTPMEARTLAKNKGVELPQNGKCAQRRNVDKDEWNRSASDDFAKFNTIEKCILFCLAGYRTEEKSSDKTAKLYYELLHIPYQDLFSPTNTEKVWNTLVQWNMNARGAKLQKEEIFTESLNENKSIMDQLCDYKLLDFLDNTKVKTIKGLMKQLYRKIKLSKSNQFVTIAKTLHFFMPQLFIPVDRTYTINYFSNYKSPDLPSNKKYQKQVEWAISVHRSLATIYKKHQLKFDELSLKTKLPITKLLDDMLIGFSMFRNEYIKGFTKDYISET